MPIIFGKNYAPVNSRPHLMYCLGITTAICFFLGTVCLGQQNPPDAPSTAAQSPEATSPQGKLAFVELMRQKSRVFPDLATNATRLSPWQKFQLASNKSVALPTFGVAIVSAAWGQALDRPYGYGEGGEAFGKRFGANMARSASANLFGTFFIASVLHEDPRFFVRRRLSFKQTLKYAAVRIAVTRSDSGDRAVNFAGLLGPLASESLANTYYPEGSRGPTSTFTRYGSDLAWTFGGNILRQYWPAINKKLRIVPPATNQQ